jgi:hypothetical protein
MGCAIAFFLPNLSEFDRGWSRCESYLEKHKRISKLVKGDKGIESYLAFAISLETHIYQEEIIKAGADKYNYFYYQDYLTHSNVLYRRVMDLCTRELIHDSMGTASRVYNIFGLNMPDLMHMDYATFVDIEERMEELDRNNIELQKMKEKALADAQNNLEK